MADHPVEARIDLIVGYDPKLPNPQQAPSVPVHGDPDTLPQRGPGGRFQRRGQAPPQPQARPVPNPPPPTAAPANSRPHPDDPPADMWPEITDPATRRRFWRERRLRISRSLTLMTRQQGQQQRQQTQTERRQARQQNQRRTRRRTLGRRRRSRQRAQAATANRDNRRFRQRLHRIRRRRIARTARRGQAARSLGRSMGSSIGAGMGARAAGPWGAAAGSWAGGITGFKAGGALAAAGPAAAVIAPLAGVVAGVAVSAVVAYKTYDTAHKTLNKVISDGIVPLGQSLGHLLPVISNFTGTIEATFKMFERDRQRYGRVTPLASMTERREEMLTFVSRMRNAQARPFGIGQNLDEYMSRFAQVRGRLTRATETIEASISREVYRKMLPVIEKIAKYVEYLAANADIIVGWTSNFLTALSEILVGVIADGIRIVFPIVGDQFIKFIESGIRAADAQVEKVFIDRQQQQRDLMKKIGNKLQSDLHALFFGVEGLTEQQKRDLEDLFGDAPKPPGLAGAWDAF